MKTLHSAILLGLGLLLPLGGFAFSPSCESLNAKEFSVGKCESNVKNSDRLKKRWPSVAKINETKTEELCQSASKAKQLSQNRCEEAVDKLKRLLADRENDSLKRCGEREKLVQSCQACASNLSAAGCQQQNINMNEGFRRRSQEMMAKRRELMSAAKSVEDEMFRLSEDYGQNISDLERDKSAKQKNSAAADKIGASSISEALKKHGNEKSGEIFRAVDTLRDLADVTKSDMDEVQKIQSQYARESLTRALEAKAARLEMEKENQQDSTSLDDLNKNTATVAKNTDNLGSVDPSASQSAAGTTPAANANSLGGLAGAAGAGMAASSAGGSAGLSGGQPAAGYGGTYDPSSKADYALNGVANGGAGTKGSGIQEVASDGLTTGENGKTDSTGASRMAMRDSLRAKLAERLGQGKATATGASQAAAGNAGGLEAKLKEKAGANPEMMMGFSAAEISAAGGGDFFSMAQSETDAAVKEMMTEFEGAVGGGADFSGARHLASVAGSQSSPAILAADSSDLFLRMREFLGRCQKRGCVTK